MRSRCSPSRALVALGSSRHQPLQPRIIEKDCQCNCSRSERDCRRCQSNCSRRSQRAQSQYRFSSSCRREQWKKPRWEIFRWIINSRRSLRQPTHSPAASSRSIASHMWIQDSGTKAQRFYRFSRRRHATVQNFPATRSRRPTSTPGSKGIKLFTST